MHAARTDRRDSQVVEEALRAYLGYSSEESPWTTDVESPAPSDATPPAGETVALEAPAPHEPVRAAEPLPPLDPEEALVLAVAELHALRDEGAGGR